MDDNFDGSEVNSPDYWNKRFFENWIAKGGREQTVFFAELCCRELPGWFLDEGRARKSAILDYGCALGDALPILQRAFPGSPVRGGDVAQVGLGLARAFHPGFEFIDVNAVGEASKLADIVYCSNTLEHFENWREILHRLSRHAREYVLVLVPFEEEDRIDEHFCTFEFDSLPAQLASGARLMHLGVCDAGLEPQTHWNGLQLIAIYGKKRRGRDPASTGSLAQPRIGSLVFDLRGVERPAIPSLLAGLAALAQARRQIARDLGEAHKLALAQAEARAEAIVGAYADLTRSIEAAQRWLLDRFAAFGPELLSSREISPVAEGWPADLPDGVAAHQATLARLIEAVHRANQLAMTFYEQAAGWRTERAALTRQLQVTRRAMEKAVGERDLAYSRALGLQETATAGGAVSGSTPLVSIVLPVYNQAYLVDEAIAGILAQTYENWELIVIDDGSNDDLEHRVRQYLDETRILFLRQPNQRLPAALNQALAYARGDLLTWTSADNIMLPNQLERLVEELAAHPDVGLVYSDYWAIDAEGGPLDDPIWRHHNRDPEIPDLIRLPSEVTIKNFHRSGDNFIGASFLYRRAVGDIVGRYADDTFGGEDFDFWLRMHLVTQFRHVAEPLYKFRVHGNTLTSRAEELGLYDNIRELLEADRWRIDTLLTDAELRSGESLLRPVSQFHAVLLKRWRPLAYPTLVEPAPAAIPEGPAVIDIDVPARAVDAAIVRHADILLCGSEVTATLLRQEDWARDKRILTWNGELTPALQHAFIQAFAEQVTKPVTAPVRRMPARIDDPFRPARILLMVERWSIGGLENVVIDLAQSLVARGRTVFVASARDAPPPAASFGAIGIPTLAFQDDESACDAFLRRNEIEVVNYHHSRFAIECAREQGVATVYTMQNSYLWMDEGARREVAIGLARMDRLIAVSRQAAQFAVAQFGIEPERIVVVPNPVRDDIMAAPPRSAIDGGAPSTIVLAASLVRLKLQHVAIAAFAEAAQDIPGMRLRLIGAPLDEAYHQELRAQIAASPQGHRIELIPGLTRAETIAALANAQVFLLPSLVEGCSVALLEAAAAGCVCIASDVGSARDLHAAGGSVVLLPSPLGELDGVTQRQFLDAAESELPEHRANIAEALRSVWRDYGSFAAGVADTRVRLRELHGMQPITDAYLLASRGGASRGGASRGGASRGGASRGGASRGGASRGGGRASRPPVAAEPAPATRE
jgi:glycosyltransferase involved in cell wall biosynthesis